jgi:hypothetical protein
MTLEIVNAEGVPAPRDGTIFNAQFSDGSVTKVRWSAPFLTAMNIVLPSGQHRPSALCRN